jgi:hypothetical protein
VVRVSSIPCEMEEVIAMAREIIHQPELHEPVLQLIRQIAQAHRAGSGQIGLFATVQLFGLPLKPEEEAMLQQRGDLVLRKESGSQGSFENQGSELKFKQGLATVTVPRLVNGTYLSLRDSVSLTFDPSHTISGRVLFVQVKLEDIRADQERLDIDLSGDAFDQTIIHSSAPACKTRGFPIGGFVRADGERWV